MEIKTLAFFADQDSKNQPFKCMYTLPGADGCIAGCVVPADREHIRMFLKETAGRKVYTLAPEVRYEVKGFNEGGSFKLVPCPPGDV